MAAIMAVALAAAGLPRVSRASEADVFEGKIQPVSGQLYSKAGRFELTPSFNPSVNDPFFSKRLFGLKLGYHFSNYWSVHAAFAAGSSSPTGSTTICSANTNPPCRSATDAELYGLPGHIKMMGGLEVGFSPVYGKLNLLAEQALHFDVSILAGADYLGFDNAIDTSALGGHLGVGVRLFFLGFMALRLELKDYLYWAQVKYPSQQSQFQSQLMAEMGLSFFFPTSPRSNR